MGFRHAELCSTVYVGFLTQLGGYCSFLPYFFKLAALYFLKKTSNIQGHSPLGQWYYMNPEPPLASTVTDRNPDRPAWMLPAPDRASSRPMRCRDPHLCPISVQDLPESLRWLMATHQFESAKKLILHFTQKNHMNPEATSKASCPVSMSSLPPQGPARHGGRQPPLQDRSPTPPHTPLVPVRALLFQAVAPSRVSLPVMVAPQLDPKALIRSKSGGGVTSTCPCSSGEARRA